MFRYVLPKVTSQPTHALMITPLVCQNDVATSFWRNYDVIITSYVHRNLAIQAKSTCQALIIKLLRQSHVSTMFWYHDLLNSMFGSLNHNHVILTLCLNRGKDSFSLAWCLSNELGSVQGFIVHSLYIPESSWGPIQYPFKMPYHTTVWNPNERAPCL